MRFQDRERLYGEGNGRRLCTLPTEWGSVLDVEMTMLDKQSKSVPIDEQANDEVVHLYRFREANRPTDQAFDPCA